MSVPTSGEVAKMTSDERLQQMFENSITNLRMVVAEINEGSGSWNTGNRTTLLEMHRRILSANDAIRDYRGHVR